MTEDVEEIVKGFADTLERSDFANARFALDQRLCCTGHECGCMGSTVGQYLAYELRQALQPVESPTVETSDDRDIHVELEEAANLLDASGDFDLRDACREASTIIAALRKGESE